MDFTVWFLIVGALLILVALTGTRIKRMPLSTSVVYLLVGFALGREGLGLVDLDPNRDTALLERLTEIAVLLSLFTAGLKLSATLDDDRWRLPLRLATSSMLVTIGLVTLVGTTLLGLPLGVAIVLGAVLAPTDPVLASDVQVSHHRDRDRVRFALTAEAGLNDGAAFPFVMLGLGLLGLHPLGDNLLRWFVVDVFWSTVAGLAIGAAVGAAIGKLVLYLRTEHREALGLDEFLTLGVIAFAYGAAVAVHAYGFLAVFAAGLALRRIEQRHGDAPAPDDVRAAARASDDVDMATRPDQASSFMARAVLGFNEQLERLGELSLVLVVAGTLTLSVVPREAWWFVPLVLCVIRPIAVAVGAPDVRTSRLQRGLIAWFGIRGIGSVYYMMYALNHGLSGEDARLVTWLTLSTVAASIIVHGISVTPLMNWYTRRRFGRSAAAA